VIRIILAILLFASTAFADTIIFETNFNSCDDWSITQPIKAGSEYSNIYPTYANGGDTDFPSDFPASGSGARYIGWFESKTFLDVNTYDTVNLSSSNARSGKAITHWSEVPDEESNGDASDGTLYISLTGTPGDVGYPEIWISTWRKYQDSFFEGPRTIKYLHVSHYDHDLYVGSSACHLTNWSGVPCYGGEEQHAPKIVAGMIGTGATDDTGNILMNHYVMTRYFPYADRAEFNPSGTDCGNFYSGTATPKVYATLDGTTIQGGWRNSGNFADGSYHFHEWHLKLNSATGAADGVLGYYIDGECQYEFSNLQWVQSGTVNDKGWNLVVLGGNNDFNAGSESEVWYAYDDVVISDYRVGSDYVIGGGPSISGVTISDLCVSEGKLCSE